MDTVLSCMVKLHVPSVALGSTVRWGLRGDTKGSKTDAVLTELTTRSRGHSSGGQRLNGSWPQGRKERLERLQRAGCLRLGNEDSMEQGTVQTRGREVGPCDPHHRARGSHRHPEQLSTYSRMGVCLAGTPLTCQLLLASLNLFPCHLCHFLSPGHCQGEAAIRSADGRPCRRGPPTIRSALCKWGWAGARTSTHRALEGLWRPRKPASPEPPGQKAAVWPGP